MGDIAPPQTWAERTIDSARKVVLVLSAVGWTLIGLGVLVGDSGSNPDLLHTRLPVWLAAAMWIGPAVMAAVTLVTRKIATATVALLIVAPVVRAASYVQGWVISLQHPGTGSPTGWYIAALHLAFVGIPVLAAILTRADSMDGDRR